MVMGVGLGVVCVCVLGGWRVGGGQCSLAL